MPNWLLSFVVKWILEQVANGGAEHLAEELRKIVVPWVQKQKDELFKRLKVEAAATETPLDDAVIKALDVFIESLIPDCKK